MLNLFISVFFITPLILAIDAVITESFELDFLVIMLIVVADSMHDKNNKGFLPDTLTYHMEHTVLARISSSHFLIGRIILTASRSKLI